MNEYRWFRNGDHPDDHCPPDAQLLKLWPDAKEYCFSVEGSVVRRYRNPHVFGYATCDRPECGMIMHDHGWLDNGGEGEVVCPGDWVVTDNEGNLTRRKHERE